MKEQKKVSAMIYSDEINKSKLNFSDKDIDFFSNEIDNIKSYITKEINQENFENLCDSWYNIINKVPLAFISINTEWILRARPNFNDEVFQEESDISYNTKKITEIRANRFNRPEESMFYGVLPSDDQAKFIAGASLECYKEIINEKNEVSVQYLTFGKWHLKSTFIAINLCFEEKALGAHPGLKKIVDQCLLDLENNLSSKAAKFIKNYWFLLSELSSKKYEYDQQYFITTAFFCVLREYYKKYSNDLINGIIYPSSMVHSDSINIVLTPEAVDKYLYLKEAFMYKFVKNTNNGRAYDCGLCSLISSVVNQKLNIKGIKTGHDLY